MTTSSTASRSTSAAPIAATGRRTWCSTFDHIVAWACKPGGGGAFQVAPATLRFHGVTDLRLSVPWEPSGFSVALRVPSIDRIEREAIADQKVFLDRPYYRWLIRLNDPKEGSIEFGAVGFTQTLRSAPVERDQPWLDRRA